MRMGRIKLALATQQPIQVLGRSGRASMQWGERARNDVLKILRVPAVWFVHKVLQTLLRSINVLESPSSESLPAR